jgi:hypothetical protein
MKLSNKLKPFHTDKNNLIRIGPNHDGGYVIDKRIIKQIKFLITCGLNDDWEFEKQFGLKNKMTKIIAYDHTVNNKFWTQRFFKDFIHFFILKKLSYLKIKNIFKYIDYLSFFKKHKHYKLKIDNKEVKNKKITINKILENKKNTLLKIDIEGDEYKIIKDILRNEKKINCLIIEIHKVRQNLKEIEEFITKLKHLKLIHIHGNNIQGQDKYGYAFAYELTFVSNTIEKKITKTEANYPLDGLDFPNVKRNKDIVINFRN